MVLMEILLKIMRQLRYSAPRISSCVSPDCPKCYIDSREGTTLLIILYTSKLYVYFGV